ncbi:MAG: hypothetical protein JXB07_01300 [Anaerolineae bacterium]|nr:hypothetical protein [Anaerolineae bacterium]
MRQFVVTPAAGKRLIARALASHPVVEAALQSRTIVIVAGTTNGYVAEEIFAVLGGGEDFTRRRFVRGVTLPPTQATTETGRIPDESQFPGDVVIEKGVWQQGKTIFDVVDELREGDLILKGANALDLEQGRAAILIGHPKAGTIGAALQAVVGRRVQLILPVGVEKRVPGSLDDLSMLLNIPEAQGARLLPVPGLVFTEIDAIELLTGAWTDIVASGGICGAEGSVWLAVSGTREQVEQAAQLLRSVGSEPPFEF